MPCEFRLDLSKRRERQHAREPRAFEHEQHVEDFLIRILVRWALARCLGAGVAPVAGTATASVQIRRGGRRAAGRAWTFLVHPRPDEGDELPDLAEDAEAWAQAALDLVGWGVLLLRSEDDDISRPAAAGGGGPSERRSMLSGHSVFWLLPLLVSIWSDGCPFRIVVKFYAKVSSSLSSGKHGSID